MAVLKQRHIDGERREFQDKWTSQYFFIANKRNSCGFSFFGNIISIPSDVDRLAKDIVRQPKHDFLSNLAVKVPQWVLIDLIS